MTHPDRFVLAGLMGWPVMHSRSPKLHNYWLGAHGWPGPMCRWRSSRRACVRRCGRCPRSVTIPDTILTVFGLLLTAVIMVPLVRWGFVNAQWGGTDRRFCATIAQGGIQPDGWSGACWAFVSAKFQQFMVGSYPYAERWRVILTAVLFVALLAPLMIPKVPYKGLNAIVFFGVFPVVGFMLLIGAALSFGLIGLIGLIVELLIGCVGAVRASSCVFPGSFFGGIGKIAGWPACRTPSPPSSPRSHRYSRGASNMSPCRSNLPRTDVTRPARRPRTSSGPSLRCGWISALGLRGARPDARGCAVRSGRSRAPLAVMFLLGSGDLDRRTRCRPAGC